MGRKPASATCSTPPAEPGWRSNGGGSRIRSLTSGIIKFRCTGPGKIYCMTKFDVRPVQFGGIKSCISMMGFFIIETMHLFKILSCLSMTFSGTLEQATSCWEIGPHLVTPPPVSPGWTLTLNTRIQSKQGSRSPMEPWTMWHRTQMVLWWIWVPLSWSTCGTGPEARISCTRYGSSSDHFVDQCDLSVGCIHVQIYQFLCCRMWQIALKSSLLSKTMSPESNSTRYRSMSCIMAPGWKFTQVTTNICKMMYWKLTHFTCFLFVWLITFIW